MGQGENIDGTLCDADGQLLVEELRIVEMQGLVIFGIGIGAGVFVPVGQAEGRTEQMGTLA